MFKHFFLGIIVGLALGVAGTLILNLPSSPGERMTIPDTVYVDYRDVELKDSLKKLPSAVSNLTHSLQSIPSFASSQPRPSGKRTRLGSTEQGHETKGWKEYADWAKTLDSDLASALVESAKTPYDPGVSPLLQEAAQQLRNIREQREKEREKNGQEYDKAKEDIDLRYSHIKSTSDPDYINRINEKETASKNWKEKEKKASSKYKEGRKRILDEFRSALKSLQ